MFAIYFKHVYDISVYQHKEAPLCVYAYKKLRRQGFM